MEASLLALGITLYAAALVPLTYGRFGRGAGLAYLATVAWGAGFGWSFALVFVGATLMVTVILGAGLGLKITRALLVTRGRGARST